MSIAMSNSAPVPSDYFTSGQHFLETFRFSPKQSETQTHGDSKVYFLQRQTWLSLHTANILPLPTQQHTLLSQLYLNSISSLYFFPFPTRLAAQTQTLYSMRPLKTIIKTFRLRTSWNFSLLYLHLKLSEEVTKHTHARYNFSSLKIITISSR